MHGIRSEPPSRRATPDDAHALAELIDFAGEGMPSYLWAGMAEPGEGVWDVGRRRARREEGGFSYRGAVVLGEGGRVAACPIGHRPPDGPEPVDHDRTPAMFVPLQGLENLAPGTWCVNVLAAHPGHRGRGHGTRLRAPAEELATAPGSKGLSVIVSGANHGARRPCERCGYRVAAERPMVKEE